MFRQLRDTAGEDLTPWGGGFSMTTNSFSSLYSATRGLKAFCQTRTAVLLVGLVATVSLAVTVPRPRDALVQRSATVVLGGQAGFRCCGQNQDS